MPKQDKEPTEESKALTNPQDSQVVAKEDPNVINKEGVLVREPQPFDPDAPPERNSKMGRFTPLVQVMLSAIIAAALIMLLVPRLAPSKAAYQADVTRLELDLVSVRENIDDIYDTLPSVTAIAETANTAKTTADTASSKADTAQGKANQNEASILYWGDRVTVLETQEINLPLEYSLGGTFGAYSLNVTAGNTGDYMAKVTIVYLTPYALSSINYTDAVKEYYTGLSTPNRSYECDLIYSGGWKVTSSSFHTGKFALAANVPTTQLISFTGLPTGTGYESYSYVEVFPAFVPGAGGGGGGI